MAGQPLLITSVIALDNLKGYFYVEAEKESYVKTAISGIRTLFKWQVKLVPLEEMVSVLTVSHPMATLQKDTWVRCKRGVYKGDLAQVVDMDENAQKVTIRLIPRLETADDDDDQKRKRKERPPARFFDPSEMPMATVYAII